VRPGDRRHPGQATRDVCSRRDLREESTRADPKAEESEVSAFEPEDWARGAGWEGAKSTATFTSGKQAALQRLVVKPVPDSDGFQERVGRKCVQCSWCGVSTRGVKGILDQYFLASHAGKGRVVTRRFGIVSLHKVKEKNKTLTGVAHNTWRSQQNTVFRKYQNLTVKREIA
jgi:hypothetical protein